MGKVSWENDPSDWIVASQGPSNATVWIWRPRRVKDAVARLKSRPEEFVHEVVGSLDHWLVFRDGNERTGESAKTHRIGEGSGPRS